MKLLKLRGGAPRKQSCEAEGSPLLADGTAVSSLLESDHDVGLRI